MTRKTLHSLCQKQKCEALTEKNHIKEKSIKSCCQYDLYYNVIKDAIQTCSWSKRDTLSSVIINCFTFTLTINTCFTIQVSLKKNRKKYISVLLKWGILIFVNVNFITALISTINFSDIQQEHYHYYHMKFSQHFHTPF